MSFLSHGAGLEVLGELSQPVADSGVASSLGLAVSPFHPVPLQPRAFPYSPTWSDHKDPETGLGLILIHSELNQLYLSVKVIFPNKVISLGSRCP